MTTLPRVQDASYQSVDWGNPVNWAHYLNRGLKFWGLNAPVMQAGTAFRDIASYKHGLLVGPPGWSKLTHPGGWGSLDFTPTGEQVRVAGGFPAFLTKTTPWSVANWVNVNVSPATKGSGVDGIWGHAVNSSDRSGVVTFQISGVPKLVAGHWNGSSYFTSKTVTIAENEWNHLVIAFNGSTMNLFLNGVESTETADTPFLDSAAHFALGNRTDVGAPEGMDGQEDDFRIYDRELMAMEAKALYDLSRVGYQEILHRIRLFAVMPVAAAGGGADVRNHIIPAYMRMAS